MIVYFNLRNILRPIKASRRWGVSLMASVLMTGLLGVSASYGQRLDPELRQSFLADPLTDEPRDPLLPTLEIDRELSPLEIYNLEQGLIQLDRRAQFLLADEDKTAEDVELAFDLWRREARLQRLFGVDAELEALGRIGQFAWDAQQSTDLLLLTARLREILADIQLDETIDEPRLEEVARIAQILRDTQSIGSAYRQLADLAAVRGDQIAYRERLEQLANYHVQWFEYAEAAVVYQQLRSESAERGDQDQLRSDLEQLVYSYQQGEYYAEAIEAQTDLLALYRVQGEVDRESPLEIAIARNYRALGQSEQAIEYYKIAYSTSQRLAQFGHSSTVLQDLGALYQEEGRFEESVSMYNLLIRVEQQSYNHYGIMQAYDHLGQIYRDRGDNDNALVAFRAGLAFAEQLNHRQDYFQSQIEAIDE